jgi:hypothetical protein
MEIAAQNSAPAASPIARHPMTDIILPTLSYL